MKNFNDYIRSPVQANKFTIAKKTTNVSMLLDGKRSLFVLMENS